jgi:hypothetical protein
VPCIASAGFAPARVILIGAVEPAGLCRAGGLG